MPEGQAARRDRPADLRHHHLRLRREAGGRADRRRARPAERGPHRRHRPFAARRGTGAGAGRRCGAIGPRTLRAGGRGRLPDGRARFRTGAQRRGRGGRVPDRQRRDRGPADRRRLAHRGDRRHLAAQRRPFYPWLGGAVHCAIRYPGTRSGGGGEIAPTPARNRPPMGHQRAQQANAGRAGQGHGHGGHGFRPVRHGRLFRRGTGPAAAGRRAG